MPGRERLKRIRTVVRLRDTQEKVCARNVAKEHAAVASATRLVSAIEANTERFRQEVAIAMRNGVDGAEVAGFHLSWLLLRKRRAAAQKVLEEARGRFRDATAAYDASRVERKRMETWEDRTAGVLRSEAEHAAAVAMDEIAVIRHGWRGGN